VSNFCTKTVQKVVLLVAIFSAAGFSQEVNYPEVVPPYDLVVLETTNLSANYDLDYLILNPPNLKSRTFEDNKYLVFVAPPKGSVTIIYQYVDWESQKSALKRVFIRVGGPEPDPEPDPSNLDALVAQWLKGLPSSFKAKDIGQNYIIAAEDVSKNSATPRDDMIGRVKVLNLQTLGPALSREWAVPFFVPLSKYMDSKNLSANDYQRHYNLFQEVGTAIKKASPSVKPNTVPVRPRQRTTFP